MPDIISRNSARAAMRRVLKPVLKYLTELISGAVESTSKRLTSMDGYCYGIIPAWRFK